MFPSLASSHTGFSEGWYRLFFFMLFFFNTVMHFFFQSFFFFFIAWIRKILANQEMIKEQMGTLVKLVYDLKKLSTTEDSPTLNTDCFPLSSFQQLQVMEGQLQQEDYKTAVVRFHISIEQFNCSINCVSVFIFCSLYMVQKVVNHMLKSYLYWLGRFDMEWLSNKRGLAW